MSIVLVVLITLMAVGSNTEAIPVLSGQFLSDQIMDRAEPYGKYSFWFVQLNFNFSLSCSLLDIEVTLSQKILAPVKNILAKFVPQNVETNKLVRLQNITKNGTGNFLKNVKKIGSHLPFSKRINNISMRNSETMLKSSFYETILKWYINLLNINNEKPIPQPDGRMPVMSHFPLVL